MTLGSLRLQKRVRTKVHKILDRLADRGVLLDGYHDISLIYSSPIEDDEDRESDRPGKPVDRVRNVCPPPRLKIRTVFRNVEGLIVKRGDAEFSRLSAYGFSRSDLEEATFWEIDGAKYKLVSGSLEEELGIFWKGILKRVEQNINERDK